MCKVRVEPLSLPVHRLLYYFSVFYKPRFQFDVYIQNFGPDSAAFLIHGLVMTTISDMKGSSTPKITIIPI